MPYGQSCYLNIEMPFPQRNNSNNGMTSSEPSYMTRRKFHFVLISIPAKRFLHELVYITTALLLLHVQTPFLEANN